jgi:hypothetical protein
MNVVTHRCATTTRWGSTRHPEVHGLGMGAAPVLCQRPQSGCDWDPTRRYHRP